MDELLPHGARRRDSALRAVLEGLPDAVVATRSNGLIDFVNARAGELFGYSPEELVGEPVTVLWPERVRDMYLRNMLALFEAGGSLRFTREAYGLRKDGREFVGEMSWGIVTTDEGPLMLAVGHDISDRLLTEARLRRGSEENRVIASLGERALAGTDPVDLGRLAVAAVGRTMEADLAVLFELTADERELRLVAAWGDTAGLPELERGAPGWHAESALESQQVVRIADGPGAALPRPGFRSGRAVALRTSKDSFGVLCVYAHGNDVLDQEDGAFLKAVASVLASAISRRRNEERVQHQALHDPLTGLANRTLCHDRLAQALARSRRSGKPVGVFFADLDHFKEVNDSYGHAAGDAVLVGVARRLQEAVRPNDTVGRFGGDEFLVICEDLDDRHARALRDRLEASTRLPVEAAGATHRLSASIGFVLADAEVTDPEALITAADEAAYRAKQRSGSR